MRNPLLAPTAHANPSSGIDQPCTCTASALPPAPNRISAASAESSNREPTK
jgi:hypothetical protein